MYQSGQPRVGHSNKQTKSQWLQKVKIYFLLILYFHGRLAGTLLHLVIVLSWGPRQKNSHYLQHRWSPWQNENRALVGPASAIKLSILDVACIAILPGARKVRELEYL